MGQSSINATPKIIKEYFDIRRDRFVIPAYQRAYSWTITQCDELFKNIEEFSVGEAGDPYFLGTIIIDSSTRGVLNLIDGQQRTTTFILLLKALLLRIEEKLAVMQEDADNKSLLNGLRGKQVKIIDILYKADEDLRTQLLDNWAIEVSKIVLLENNSINEQFKDELQRILAARTFQEAEATCNTFRRKKKDNKYTAFFRNFKFFYTKLGEDFYGEANLNKFAKKLLEECQVIEIRSDNFEQAIMMFNSLNSKGLPLETADIISAQLFEKSKGNVNEFKEKWEELKSLVAELEARNVIDIDAVLQQYMYIRRAQTKAYNPGDVTTPGVRNYYLNIDPDCMKNPEVLSDNFLKIAKIWQEVQEYPIIKLLLKFNENIKLFLILYLNRFEPAQIKAEEVTGIAECLIRLFAILELVDTGYSSKNFKTFLFNESLKLVDTKYSLADIRADFDAHILLNRDKWGRDILAASLSDYDKNILVFLNEYLFAKMHGDTFILDDNVNIEHIMPASGHNIESIREDAKLSKEDFSSVVNRLGNKILLEEAINKSIGNEWFKTKKQNTVTDKRGYKDSKYCIARALVNYPSDTWTVADVERATTKATDRILDFILNGNQ